LILRRKKYALALAVIPALAIAFILWRVVPKDKASHITSLQSVRLFEQRSNREPRRKDPGGQWPEPGVYRYATHGRESIDTGLLSASHDYEGMSTVTVWSTRCGMAERWQVLATRWSESDTCGGRKGELSSLREFHQFFGVSQEDRFGCDGLSALSMAKNPPPRPTATVCRSDTTTVTSKLQVLGTAQIDVAGEAVDAVHLTGTTIVKGESAGLVKFSEWRRRSDGLLLRRTSGGAIDSDSNGGFSYAENYSIRLLSLAPER
jgi:hypothetical protein